VDLDEDLLQIHSQEQYDNFLKTKKQGRFVRVGEWGGMKKGILHRCADPICAREWKPKPIQCLPDDYYCPSCVLHHRNNDYRFDEPRLAWTAEVPNTFYVFSIVDPKVGQLIKFGRTQHKDAWKRYNSTEQTKYNMQLLLSLRGPLRKMTKIENWWKEEGTKNGYFCKFSDASFHGMTECFQIIDDQLIQLLFTQSRQMAE